LTIAIILIHYYFFEFHHYHLFNVHVSMQSTCWMVAPKIWNLWSNTSTKVYTHICKVIIPYTVSCSLIASIKLCSPSMMRLFKYMIEWSFDFDIRILKLSVLIQVNIWLAVRHWFGCLAASAESNWKGH